MKQYVNPELHVILMGANDVILASSGGTNDVSYDVTDWLGGNGL